MDFSFTWIFAFIVGAMILFGAFYGVNKFMEIKQLEGSGQAALNLKSLLNPLETGIESSKAQAISLAVESRISNKCTDYGNFGKQIVEIEEKINKKWSKSLEVSFENKYLFFPEYLEGKNFYIFSKSFEFPYKIANLMFMTNKDEFFCFVNTPREIGKELESQNQSNFLFKSSTLDCPDYSKNICFSSISSNCDILVDTTHKRVNKDGDDVYYETEGLLYGAIFSDKDVYECEVKRLMKRAKSINDIYELKSVNLLSSNCDSTIRNDLGPLGNLFTLYSSSFDLATMRNQVNSIKSRNTNSPCRLW